MLEKRPQIADFRDFLRLQPPADTGIGVCALRRRGGFWGFRFGGVRVQEVLQNADEGFGFEIGGWKAKVHGAFVSDADAAYALAAGAHRAPAHEGAEPGEVFDGKNHIRGFGDDRDDRPLLREHFDFGEAEERFDGLGHRAKSIDDILREGLEHFEVVGAREAAIEIHALAFGIDVALGKNRGGADFDVHFLGLDDWLILDALYRFFEELTVHFITNGGDVAGLLGAQDVACAADLEIAQGDFEAGAQ